MTTMKDQTVNNPVNNPAKPQTIRRDILTAVPVAFHPDGSLNVDGSTQILRKVAESNVQGAFVLGTTGEFPSLSVAERELLTRLSIDELPGKRVVVHTGAGSAFEVLQLIEQVKRFGGTEIAVVTPYYLPATRQAILDFYRQVSAASDGLRVYVYLFRAFTGNEVSADLLAELATLPNVVGAKVSGETLAVIAGFRAAVPADFELFTGADRDLARAADSGAQGVVSGISSVLAGPFVTLQTALATGSDAEVAAAQEAVYDVVDTLQGDLGRMKASLRLQGVDAGHPRMAVEEPTAEVLDEIRRVTDLYA